MVASLLVEHRLWRVQVSVATVPGLSNCGPWAELLRSMGDLPGKWILYHCATREGPLVEV